MTTCNISLITIFPDTREVVKWYVMEYVQEVAVKYTVECRSKYFARQGLFC